MLPRQKDPIRLDCNFEMILRRSYLHGKLKKLAYITFASYLH